VQPERAAGEAAAFEVPGSEASSVELEGVSKTFGDVVALREVTLDATPGEFLVLLGPSGCGKSTVLRLIAGLEAPTAGSIRIGGREMNRVVTKDRDVAMVFQSYALYPHLSVRKNIEFPLRSRGVPRDEIKDIVPKVAASLRLDGLLGRKPAALSGGQRQRVALARALVRRPKVFLMDEPLSNLDALLRVQMRSELLKLHRRVGRTTVYVTHDQVEAMTMADRIVVLRLGVIQQVGTTADVYLRPANTFVATFVGSPQMNLFTGAVDTTPGALTFSGPVTVPLDARWASCSLEARMTLGVRPEDVLLVGPSEDGTVAASVDLVEAIGPENYVSLTLIGGATCVARTSAKVAIREGDPVHVRFAPDAIHLFDADGKRAQSAGS